MAGVWRHCPLGLSAEGDMDFVERSRHCRDSLFLPRPEWWKPAWIQPPLPLWGIGMTGGGRHMRGRRMGQAEESGGIGWMPACSTGTHMRSHVPAQWMPLPTWFSATTSSSSSSSLPPSLPLAYKAKCNQRLWEGISKTRKEENSMYFFKRKEKEGPL